MLTRISLRTWQQSMTTIMQPFQCYLRPEIQETQKELRTQEQPLVAEHRGGTSLRMK